MNMTISFKRSRSVIYALAGLMLSGTVIDFFNAMTLAATGRQLPILETVISTCGIILFFLCLPQLLKRRGGFVVESTLFFGLLWFMTGLIFPENQIYLQSNAKQFFIYVLPYYWIGTYLVSKGMYLDDFLKIGRVKLIIALVTQLLILAIPKADIFHGDYMDAANAMLVGLIAVFYLATRDHSKFDIVLSVAGIVVVLINGSRNVLLAILIFWFLIIVLSERRKKWVWIVCLIAVGTILTFFYRPLFDGLYNISKSFGISTHLVEALNTNSMFEDTQRISLYKGFWEAIRKNPIFGYGIMGDRVISLNMDIFHKSIYPHNIVLELFMDFGVLVGTILIGWLIAGITSGFRSKNFRYRYAVLVLVCCSVVKLMVSSTFWNDQMFFLLLGFLICRKRVAEEQNFHV